MSRCFWQKLPAVRLLIPFMLGIYCQWRLNFPAATVILLFLTCLFVVVLYYFFPLRKKFQLTSLAGMMLQLVFFSFGTIVFQLNEVKIDAAFNQSREFAAVLEEAPVEKKNSYKATAALYRLNEVAGSSRLIIYFEKDSSVASELLEGTEIIFTKTPEEISNSENPGGFDFKSWCLLQGITHQVYLTHRQFVAAPHTEPAGHWIGKTRNHVLQTIRNHIKGKKEQGLAEALLIGYKHDLDRSLVQAYANTGVVHVIAISGLHLGIIYTILLFFTRPLNRKKFFWLRFLLIISGIWAFTLLAGAQASVMRSAVMFSFIAASYVLQRTSNTVNTMALSAFLLLAWKPYWLWDIGFQLSYTAVLSIVLFFRPVYNLFYFRRMVFDMPWKMTAVTISAQILTLPLTLFYFHQFPVLLLITNLLAVPLSSLILVLEIALMGLGPFHAIASLTGSVITWLIQFLNFFIGKANEMPFVTWEGINISQLQVVCLYITIITVSVWLMRGFRAGPFISLAAVMAFVILRSHSFYQASVQQKMIVYNIPKAGAADIITGRTAVFISDSVVMQNPEISNFHIGPSRVMHRIAKEVSSPPHSMLTVGEKKILFINKGSLPFINEKFDIIVVSGGVEVPDMKRSLNETGIVVLDGSVPYWKRLRWKKRLVDRDIHIHAVADDGAFVMSF